MSPKPTEGRQAEVRKKLEAQGGIAGALDKAEATDYQKLVDTYYLMGKARAEANRRLKIDQAADIPYIQSYVLGEFLGTDFGETEYLIEGLWPSTMTVVFSAMKKAGKTTVVHNAIRSLSDGVDFLGKFPVRKLSGRVGLIDTELSPLTLQDEIEKHGIKDQSKACFIPMAGNLRGFDLSNDDIREHWTNRLMLEDIEVLIVDCIAYLFPIMGLDEDRDFLKLAEYFNLMIQPTGITEWALVHHMGWEGTRFRGDSKGPGWAGVEWWEYKRDNDETREFKAYGRGDVNIPRTALAFNPSNKHIEIDDKPKVTEQIIEVLNIIYNLHNELGRLPSQNQVSTKITSNKTIAKKRIDAALGMGLIKISPVGQANYYDLTEEGHDIRLSWDHTVILPDGPK